MILETNVGLPSLYINKLFNIKERTDICMCAMFLNRLRKNNILTIFFSFYFRVLSFLVLSAETSFGKPLVYVTFFVWPLTAYQVICLMFFQLSGTPFGEGLNNARQTVLESQLHKLILFINLIIL